MTDPVSATDPGVDEDDDPIGPAPGIVSFDIGEVLIDETRLWGLWAELLGVSPASLAAVLGAAIAQGGDHRDVFAHIAPNAEPGELEPEHERRYGGFQEQDIYADVRPCLQDLHDLGFRIVIAGNQPARRTAQLQGLELPHDHLATSDDLGAQKPDEAFFAAVLELAGASDPADVLYVGDRVDNDVLPAAAFGMRTCWLRRGPWGQLQDLPDEVEPELSLEGLGELATLLSQWRDAT